MSAARKLKTTEPGSESAAEVEAAANQAPAANSAPKVQIDPSKYLGFVRKVACRMARNLPSHVSLDDLIGAGMLGLIDAKERYDPAKADRFETFAEFRVKGAILDELRRYDIMARNARLTSKKLARKVQELTAILGRPPRDQEVARALDLNVVDYRNLVSRVGSVRVMSLDDLTGEHDAANDRAYELRAPGMSPHDMTAIRELQAHLERAIQGLPDRQQRILNMYYRNEMTLKQIGKELGVTESRVCQIMGEATKKLRIMLRNEGARRG